MLTCHLCSCCCRSQQESQQQLQLTPPSELLLAASPARATGVAGAGGAICFGLAGGLHKVLWHV